MGGICGFLGYGDQSLLKKMSQEISHRGLYEDLFVDKNVGMCSRGVAKEDSLGKNEDGSLIVALDGEILNAEELRTSLKFKGHNFSSFNYAELLTHLYEEYNYQAVNELRGSFSFALWDSNKKLLLLARDREGEKSVFYVFSNGSIYFASEIKPFLHCGVIEKKLNQSGLDYFFSWGHVPAPETLFAGVMKLPPSHLLTYKYSENKIVLHKYWDLDFSKIEYDVSEDEWCRRIYSMLVESVSIRLKKGPFGVLLGGLDSSAIAALIRKLTNEPISSVTIMFENEEFDKSYSKYVAEWLGIEALEKTLYAKDFIRTIEEITRIFDDLRIDLVITIPSFLALETIKGKAKTVFTGDDSDCAFWSWGWPHSDKRKPKFPLTALRFLSKGSYSENVPNPWTIMSKVWRSLEDSLKAKILTANLHPELKSLYYYQYFHEDELRELLGRCSSVNVYSPFVKCVKSPADDFEEKMNRMRVMFKAFDVIGGWGVERVGVICSHIDLIARMPFVDHKLNELTARIPPLLKQPDDKTEKYIFKKTLLKFSVLPKEVIKQKKWGFGWELPEIAARWFKGELKDYVEQTLNESTPLIKHILREKHIKKYTREGRPIQVLSLLTFILWYRHFFAQD